ncbi:uncharacterized protein [Anabrus simplex]|uniref:uncharacterized protein n=1 Tax=Anabrus simplex TaxID=316456 RepID=UPI0035A315BE
MDGANKDCLLNNMKDSANRRQGHYISIFIVFIVPTLRAEEYSYKAGNISRIMTGSSGRQGPIMGYGPYSGGYQEPMYYPATGSSGGSEYELGYPYPNYQYPSYQRPDVHHPQEKPPTHATFVPTEKFSWLSGLLKAGLAILGAKLLLKIPLFLLKLVLAPVTLLFFGAPMLPLITAYYLPSGTITVTTSNSTSNSTTTTTTTTAQPATRRRRKGRQWSPCAARVACHLGETAAGFEFGDIVTRLLEELQSGVPETYRTDLATLQEAYLSGATLRNCSQLTHFCPDL